MRVVLESSIKCPPRINIITIANIGWTINLKKVIKTAILTWSHFIFLERIIPSAKRAHGAAEREINSNVLSIPIGKS